VKDILERIPRGIGTRKVFLENGAPVNRRKHQRNYSSTVKKADLADFTFHDFRHATINNTRLAGNDYFWFMAQSGHKTMSIFWVYPSFPNGVNLG